MPKQAFIYIVTNKTNKVLYIGVTNNLHRRIHEHKLKLTPGFTTKYNTNKLVYYEVHARTHRRCYSQRKISKRKKEGGKNQTNRKYEPRMARFIQRPIVFKPKFQAPNFKG